MSDDLKQRFPMLDVPHPWSVEVDQLKAEIASLTDEANEWRCADRDKAATIAALEIACDEARAERDEALKVLALDRLDVEIVRLTAAHDAALALLRELRVDIAAQYDPDDVLVMVAKIDALLSKEQP